jgi:hypothetical protein
MKRPTPPFLELGLYFAQSADAESFAQLVDTLVGVGAKFAGNGTVHHGKGFRDQSFASITDFALEPVTVRNRTDFIQHSRDPDRRLIQIYMEGASGIKHEVTEIIGYESISEEAAHQDHHPLAIWTEGIIFSGTPEQQSTARAQEIGRQLYERLRLLLEALKPSYAAITVEYSLECPTDLRRDVRSLAFRDFFVSGTCVGMNNLRTVSDLFQGAYIETVADGLYISCTPEFNPQGNRLDNEYAQWQSMEVAKLIAAVAKSYRHRTG